ncbi:MAG: glutathione S-transferase N-terminal domain-containing protein [Candidatus Yanofskybacteria bacterium]|nr:glutathione S-transferase N-terminal domain-containing protein [Candidatus Yanofskybacteria bacterium]
MDNNVEIYTTPSCPYCHLAKEYFKSKGIDYKEYNVAQDVKKREEMLKLVGQIAVPVIVINGQAILGFNKAKINELLGIN